MTTFPFANDSSEGDNTLTIGLNFAGIQVLNQRLTHHILMEQWA